jgi:hypothetical protein
MGAEQFVNVTCRGLEVGKSLKLLDFGPSTAFLEAATPVPVGTPLEITTDNGLTIAARVVRVQEQVAGAETAPGMRVAVELGSKAKGWWAEQVSRTDPVIPEPVRRPPGAADAIPTETDIETTIPSAAVPVKPPATRTQIMDVSEIAAAIEAGGQHLDAGDGTPQAELEVMPTDQVGDGEGGGGNGESEDSASRRGRKKKRRR